MGFFNFNNANTNADTAADAGSQKPIILQVNEDTIEVSFEEADGKSIGELFNEFASDFADTDRINRYVSAGQIVDANDTPTPGTVYRGAITSETKGLA